jgi:hypothetical protein
MLMLTRRKFVNMGICASATLATSVLGFAANAGVKFGWGHRLELATGRQG